MNATALLVGALFASVAAHFDTVHALYAVNLSIRENCQKPLSDFRRILVIVQFFQCDTKDELHPNLLLRKGPLRLSDHRVS